MPRIGGVMMSDDAARDVARQVQRALLEAEPAEALARVVSRHVPAHGEQLPRIPVIGMEPGAIRGSRPGVGRC